MEISLRRFTGSRFVRNVFTVSAGVAGAQAIALIFTPILTRLYSPDAYGVLGMFTAASTILLPLATLAYPIATVIAEDEEEARGIALLSFRLLVTVTLTVLLVSVFVREQLFDWGNIENVNPWLIVLLPLGILFSGMQQINEQLAIRYHAFRVSALGSVTSSLLANAGKLGAGLVYAAPGALVAAHILNSAVYAWFVRFGLRENLGGKARVRGDSLTGLAQKYADFPRYRAPEIALNAVAQTLPIWVLAWLFGPAAAGFYTLAMTVLAVPTRLVGKAVGDVFYPKITEAAREQRQLTAILKQATLVLLSLGIIPFLALALSAPWLFEVVFGEEWRSAGEYATWLAVWSLFLFVNTPSVKAIPVIREQRALLIYTVVVATGRLACLLAGYVMTQDDLVSIAMFSVFGAVANTLLIAYVYVRSARFQENFEEKIAT